MLSKCDRRGEGKIGMGALLVVGVILCILANSPEGKRLLQKAVESPQTPVMVRLSPYWIDTGYYVHITNISANPLYGVKVTYMSVQGISKQVIGIINSGETKTLDPSQVNWRVELHELIWISADGFSDKIEGTNELLKASKK